MGCSPWGHKELDTTERVNNNKSHYTTLQQKPGKFSTCVQLHLKEKLYQTKLEDPTSISSYPRILTFGPTLKMIGTSAENFLENSILYPSYAWIPTPTSSMSDETGILSLLTPKLSAWGYSFNIVLGCCAWEWKCVYWGFFSFVFYLWELIAEMVFGVGDAVIGFGRPLAGEPQSITH